MAGLPIPAPTIAAWVQPTDPEDGVARGKARVWDSGTAEPSSPKKAMKRRMFAGLPVSKSRIKGYKY
jgi:hypothetical protein